jgi:type IV pilus assembly protein PilE
MASGLKPRDGAMRPRVAPWIMRMKTQPPLLASGTPPTRGFTLIELMIAIAIAALLATVALPSYLSYVRRGNRVDATSLLQAANLAQERYRLGHTAYSSATTDLSPPCPTSGGCTSERQHYTLAISGVSGTAYTLTANAASSQQSADSGCTAIVLSVSGGTTQYSPAACWSK